MTNIIKLPASTTLTVEQALSSSLHAELDEVLIVGRHTDGDLFIRSSKMDVKTAFWLAELAKNWALNN